MEYYTFSRTCTDCIVDHSHPHASCRKHKVTTNGTARTDFTIDMEADVEVPMSNFLAAMICIIEYCDSFRTVSLTEPSTIWCNGEHNTAFFSYREMTSELDNHITASASTSVASMLNTFMKRKEEAGLGVEYSAKVFEVVNKLKDRFEGIDHTYFLFRCLYDDVHAVEKK